MDRIDVRTWLWGISKQAALAPAALIVGEKQVGCSALPSRFKTRIIPSPGRNTELLSSISMQIWAVLESDHVWHHVWLGGRE